MTESRKSQLKSLTLVTQVSALSNVTVRTQGVIIQNILKPNLKILMQGREYQQRVIKAALMVNARTRQNLVCRVGSVAECVWWGQWKSLVSHCVRVCVRECVCERVPAHVFSGMAVGQTAAQYGLDFVAHSSDILVLNTRYWEQTDTHTEMQMYKWKSLCSHNYEAFLL